MGIAAPAFISDPLRLPKAGGAETGGGTGGFTGGNDGSQAGGHLQGPGEAKIRTAALGLGARAFGYSRATAGAKSLIEGAGKGAQASGFAYGHNLGDAQLRATGDGSFAHGWIDNQGNASGYFDYPYMDASGKGSLALGYLKSGYFYNFGYTKSQAQGALVGGWNVNEGGYGNYIFNNSGAHGSFLWGAARHVAGGDPYAYAQLNTGHVGTAVLGYAKADERGTVIQATTPGAFATGYAKDGGISASNTGARAGGYSGSIGGAGARSRLYAQGKGSLAHGFVKASNGANADMRAQGYGSVAMGSMSNSSTGVVTQYAGTIGNYATHFAHSRFTGTGAGSPARATQRGAWISGYHRADTPGGSLSALASGRGSLVHGESFASGGDSTFGATTTGSVALGRVFATLKPATLRSSGQGGIAFGNAYNGKIVSASGGTLAGGYSRALAATADTYIRAVGNGAVAIGSVKADGVAEAELYASAVGAAAFGGKYSDNSSGYDYPIGAHAVGAFHAGYTKIEAGNHYGWGGRATGVGSACFGYHRSGNALGTFNYGGPYSEASGKGAMIGGYGVQSQNYYNGALQAQGPGNIAWGHTEGINDNSGYIRAGTFAASEGGAIALGRAKGGDIFAYGSGSMAVGYANTKGQIRTQFAGSFAGGYVKGDDQRARIKADQRGAFAFGRVVGNGTFARSYLDADGLGAAAFGSVSDFRSSGANYVQGALNTGAFFTGGLNITSHASGGYMRATGKGARVGGYHRATAGYGPYVRAQGTGSFAFGYTWDAGFSYGNHLRADGDGSVALGIAKADAAAAGEIYTGGSSHGSLAGGYALGQQIRTNGLGAFAWGHAVTGDIEANANNAFQLGEGINGQADSMQVGSTVRLKGTTGAPGVLQNGDIWVNAGYLYARTNGVTGKIQVA